MTKEIKCGCDDYIFCVNEANSESGFKKRLEEFEEHGYKFSESLCEEEIKELKESIVKDRIRNETYFRLKDVKRYITCRAKSKDDCPIDKMIKKFLEGNLYENGN